MPLLEAKKITLIDCKPKLYKRLVLKNCSTVSANGNSTRFFSLASVSTIFGFGRKNSESRILTDMKSLTKHKITAVNTEIIHAGVQFVPVTSDIAFLVWSVRFMIVQVYSLCNSQLITLKLEILNEKNQAS